tara:strand:+ start:253 stop:429 length:177 start_codon:yes stop_codon:yes gene_type:complete
MNYTEKMNSLMAQSHQIQECASGLCEHPEHKVNALVWIIPAVAGVFLLNKVYKRIMKQ